LFASDRDRRASVGELEVIASDERATKIWSTVADLLVPRHHGTVASWREKPVAAWTRRSTGTSSTRRTDVRARQRAGRPSRRTRRGRPRAISVVLPANPFNNDGAACQGGGIGTPFFLFTTGPREREAVRRRLPDRRPDHGRLERCQRLGGLVSATVNPQGGP